MYDLVIIGAGPAGLSAGVYAKRANLDCVIIEKNFVSGGQVLLTDTVDNYLGFLGTNGYTLGETFEKHAKDLGVVISNDEITKVEKLEDACGQYFRLTGLTDLKVYECRCLLVCTGAKHRLLDVPGENKLMGSGVSYCATCDGAFFKGKDVVVVGGGDVAVEDAIYLSKLCAHVYLVHRRNSLRAAQSLQDVLFSLANVEIIWDSTIDEIIGETQVESVIVKNKSGISVALPVSGVFVGVGILPVNELIFNLCATKDGYIVAGEDCATSQPGLFVAGDLRTKPLRQIITAVCDGANAVNSIEHYLQKIAK